VRKLPGCHRSNALSSRLAGFGTTIFAEMSALAVETGAINLGQGFPDTDGPPRCSTPRRRHPRGSTSTRPARARSSCDRRSPITSAASTDRPRPGDARSWSPPVPPKPWPAPCSACSTPATRSCVFEPMYDSYQAGIALAGARAVPVLLRPGADGRYVFDPDEFRSAVTARTKLVLLNTPHNPTGKVFTADELALIAEVAIEHDLIVVTDEVYEHLVFDGRTHIPMATLPGMAERTLTISSGGKTFHTTGLEDRLDDGAGAAGGGGADGQAVPHLRQRRTVPAGDGGRDSVCPTRTSPASQASCRPPATTWSPACAPPASPPTNPRRRTSRPSTSARRTVDGDGMAFCRSAAATLRCRRRAERGLLRPPRTRPPPRAVRLLQAARRDRRRRRRLVEGFAP
jgi:hypothetical protein